MNLNDIAIVIPSLNPDEKFTRVVDGMIAAGFSRFVLVDDGSDAEHKPPFKNAMATGLCTLLVHEINMGKGQALKDAFKYVYENFPEIDAVITIDGDGQHTPEDARNLAERLAEKPGEVVFGCRDFDQPNVPTHNKLGNKITSKVFKLLFGMKLSDTQTGLRGIPRKYLKPFVLEVEGTRFEYESNMLLYMSENRIPYSEVAIQTLYIEENKSSHFHPVRDSIRIYKPIIKKSKSLKYVLSSSACAVIDELLFTIFNALFKGVQLLWLQTFLTTGLARIISAVCNFLINRNIVFRSNSSARKSALRYIITALCQYAASYGLCMLFFSLMAKGGHVGTVRTLVKTAVDLFLFFVSYQVQKYWVFNK